MLNLCSTYCVVNRDDDVIVVLLFLLKYYDHRPYHILRLKLMKVLLILTIAQHDVKSKHLILLYVQCSLLANDHGLQLTKIYLQPNRLMNCQQRHYSNRYNLQYVIPIRLFHVDYEDKQLYVPVINTKKHEDEKNKNKIITIFLHTYIHKYLVFEIKNNKTLLG